MSHIANNNIDNSIDRRHVKWGSEQIPVTLSRNELMILRFIANLNFAHRIMQTISQEDLDSLKSAMNNMQKRLGV